MKGRLQIEDRDAVIRLRESSVSVGRQGWKRVVLLLSLLTIGSSLSSCSLVYQSIPFRTVRDVSSFDQRLHAAIAASPNLSIRALGTVTYGSFTAPVWLVSYTPDQEPRYSVFMSGGMHGLESAGPEAVVSFIEALGRDHSCYPDIAMEFVPLVNPWGWSRDLRLNRAGIDINRAYETPKSQEAVLLRGFLDGRRYDLMIDHHEDSNYRRFYMMTYDNPDLDRARLVTRALSRAGFEFRTDHGYDGLINLDQREMSSTSITTLMLYARTHYSDRAYIVETPYDAELEDSVTMSGIVDRVLIQGLTDGTAAAGSDRACQGAR